MVLLDKTLNSIVDIELSEHSHITLCAKQLSAQYISDALLLMPWFYRYPLSLLVISVNLIALFLKGSIYYNLTVSDRRIMWERIANYPGYLSLKILIRTLTLLSSYSHYDKKN
jgi:hypothetical protein